MTVLSYRMELAGENEGNLPRVGRMLTNDLLATIATAGYLDQYIQSQAYDIKSSDVLLAVGTNGTQWYKPVFAASGSCTLTILP
jgi:hypothetical protein